MCIHGGVFLLLRVGELEGMRRADVSLSIDTDGDSILRPDPTRSKTDHYNAGHAKVIKGADRPLFPVRGFARWLGIRHSDNPDDTPLFNRNRRMVLAHSLNLAASIVGIDQERVTDRAIRSFGASLMSDVGFEMEIAIRRGTWCSSAFRHYIWRDEHILSYISCGRLPSQSNHGRAGRKRTREMTVDKRTHHQRLVGISKCKSGALRSRRAGSSTRRDESPSVDGQAHDV